MAPRFALLVATAFLLLAACASAPRTEGAPRSGGANSLTQAELSEATESNMYDLIRARRSHWLQRARPTTVLGAGGGYPLQIYLDNVRMGDVETLRHISPQTIRVARYLTPTQAQGRFGEGNINGAIELITAR